MFDFVRAVKFGVVAAGVTLMLLAAPSQSQAATGRVHARLLKAGFIVGAGGGNGTLTFQGRTYPLTFSGVSMGDHSRDQVVDLAALRRPAPLMIH